MNDFRAKYHICAWKIIKCMTVKPHGLVKETTV